MNRRAHVPHPTPSPRPPRICSPADPRVSQSPKSLSASTSSLPPQSRPQSGPWRYPVTEYPTAPGSPPPRHNPQASATQFLSSRSCSLSATLRGRQDNAKDREEQIPPRARNHGPLGSPKPPVPLRCVRNRCNKAQLLRWSQRLPKNQSVLAGDRFLVTVVRLKRRFREGNHTCKVGLGDTICRRRP